MHRELREARDLDIAAAARAGIGASEIARLIGLDRRHVSAIAKRIREQREAELVWEKNNDSQDR